MHSIRIIGPGRAGTSLAAALSARGWAFAGFLGRHDELARAADGCRPARHRHPRRRRDRGRRGGRAVARHHGGAPLRLARARCAGAAPAARHGAPSGATPQRGGRRRPPGLGRDLCRGRRAVGPGHGDQPRRADGRGRRRRPGGVPRSRLHRGQSRGGVARTGGAGGRLGRAGPRVVPPADPGRRRRRGGPGRRRGTDRSRPPGRLGHPQPPPRCAARVRARRLSGRRRPGDPPGPGRGPSAGATGRHGAGPAGRHSASPAGRHGAGPAGRHSASPAGRHGAGPAGRHSASPAGRHVPAQPAAV